MATGHLLGLLHHRQRPRQNPFAVQHLPQHGAAHNPAVIAADRQMAQRLGRQALGIVWPPVIDRDLGSQRIEFGLQRRLQRDLAQPHLLLGARQQRVNFAVAVLALRQPGLQQRQTGVQDQHIVR